MRLEPFFLSGRRIEVEFVSAKENEKSVSFDGNKVLVRAENETEAKRLIYKWVRKRVSLLIKQSAWRQSRMLGIDSFRLKIKDQRSRWGSCSRRKNLSFNFRIGLAPKEVMDYVVLHELVHLKHMNHSDKFWNEVAKYSPSYKEHEKWLKKNAYLLMNPKPAG